jgi:hypothetical protein
MSSYSIRSFIGGEWDPLPLNSAFSCGLMPRCTINLV